MEYVNLAVGIIAIVLSFASIITNIIIYFMSKNTLEKIEVTSENIENTVDERVKDLIERAAPSHEEKTQNKLLEMVFGNMEGMEDVKDFMDVAKKAQELDQDD